MSGSRGVKGRVSLGFWLLQEGDERRALYGDGLELRAQGYRTPVVVRLRDIGGETVVEVLAPGYRSCEVTVGDRHFPANLVDPDAGLWIGRVETEDVESLRCALAIYVQQELG